FDSLHHAVDEMGAVRMVYRALKPAGICVTSEPGKGHAKSPLVVEFARKYNVTEKDMPPGRIISLGKQAGFRKFRTYPHAHDLKKLTYSSRFLGARVPKLNLLRKLANFIFITGILFYRERNNGIVTMVK